MSHAANRTCIGSTTNSARPSAYGRLFWLATAELGINLPVVVKAADPNRISGRRYIYLEPLVPHPSCESADFREEDKTLAKVGAK